MKQSNVDTTAPLYRTKSVFQVGLYQSGWSEINNSASETQRGTNTVFTPHAKNPGMSSLNLSTGQVGNEEAILLVLRQSISLLAAYMNT